MNLSWLTDKYFILVYLGCLPLLAFSTYAAVRCFNLAISTRQFWRIVMNCWILALSILLISFFVLFNFLHIEDAGPGAFIWLIGVPLLVFLPSYWIVLANSLIHATNTAVSRAVLASLLSVLLVPLLFLASGLGMDLIRRSANDHRIQQRQLARNAVPNVHPSQFGLVEPAGFKPYMLADRRSVKDVTSTLPYTWEQEPDYIAEIQHLQADGYSIPSELANKPWNEMVEEAAIELVAGLDSAGCSIMLGRGLYEHTKVSGTWQSYFEPVIAGSTENYLVLATIVPDPTPIGSAPRILLRVYTEDPAGILGKAISRYSLIEIDSGMTDKLFEIREGYIASGDFK